MLRYRTIGRERLLRTATGPAIARDTAESSLKIEYLQKTGFRVRSDAATLKHQRRNAVLSPERDSASDRTRPIEAIKGNVGDRRLSKIVVDRRLGNLLSARQSQTSRSRSLLMSY